MEIEAKYTASGAQFAGLLEANALGDYSLETLKEQRLIDYYMDTCDHDIRRGGYTCRMRNSNGQWLIAVKGLGGAEGAIHQREEYEMKVAPDVPVQKWPDCHARNLVLSLSRSQALAELCVIRQHRTVRSVHRGERRIGVMSLDVVDMESVGQSEKTYEVEIELEQDGALEDLRLLGDILQNYGLCPEPRSKFERAMTQLE